MTTNPLTSTYDPQTSLATAAALLWRASDRTWVQARSDPDLELRFRGVGIDIAADQALGLLTDVALMELVGEITESEPVELLRSAEKVLRQCPIEQFPLGTSHLVVAVCDLIGEHD